MPSTILQLLSCLADEWKEPLLNPSGGGGGTVVGLKQFSGDIPTLEPAWHVCGYSSYVQ